LSVLIRPGLKVKSRVSPARTDNNVYPRELFAAASFRQTDSAEKRKESPAKSLLVYIHVC